jgi:hypothetical protein
MPDNDSRMARSQKGNIESIRILAVPNGHGFFDFHWTSSKEKQILYIDWLINPFFYLNLQLKRMIGNEKNNLLCFLRNDWCMLHGMQER